MINPNASSFLTSKPNEYKPERIQMETSDSEIHLSHVYILQNKGDAKQDEIPTKFNPPFGPNRWHENQDLDEESPSKNSIFSCRRDIPFPLKGLERLLNA